MDFKLQPRSHLTNKVFQCPDCLEPYLDDVNVAAINSFDNKCVNCQQSDNDLNEMWKTLSDTEKREFRARGERLFRWIISGK